MAVLVLNEEIARSETHKNVSNQNAIKDYVNLLTL